MKKKKIKSTPQKTSMNANVTVQPKISNKLLKSKSRVSIIKKTQINPKMKIKIVNQ